MNSLHAAKKLGNSITDAHLKEKRSSAACAPCPPMCPPQKNQVAEWFFRRKAFEKIALQLCTPPLSATPPGGRVGGGAPGGYLCSPDTYETTAAVVASSVSPLTRS